MRKTIRICAQNPFHTIRIAGKVLKMNLGLIAPVALMLLFSLPANMSWVIVRSGFQLGNVVTIGYSNITTCSPPLVSLYLGYPEAINASRVTNCEMGVGISVPYNSVPTYLLVPAFAGLSIYGFQSLNSSAEGYATFNGLPVPTFCGATGTQSGCIGAPNSIVNFYSPLISAWEKSLGIKTGIGGLPEGVMPNSAYDLLVPHTAMPGQVSYYVRVLVYDPNIMPNITTGKCTAMVQSNLTDPIGNCLNSREALQRALVTTDSAVIVANKNNPLFTTIRSVPVQAAIIKANVTSTNVTYSGTTDVNASNMNVYRTIVLVTPAISAAATASSATTSITTTTIVQSSSSAIAPGGSILVSVGSAVAVIIVMCLVVVYLMRADHKMK